MENDTTTSTTVDDQAATEETQPQLDTTDNAEAVETTDDTSQTSSEDTGSETDNSAEAEIKEWAAKKNLPLDDPMKIAKMYRDAERELGKKGQQTGQLNKSVETASQSIGADDIQMLNNKLSVMDFYLANPDARSYDAKMAEILESKPYLANDLDTLLLVAKANTSSEELLNARKTGRQEALASVAQAERAAPPKASATTREAPKELTDADVANMTLAQYEAAKAAGKIDPFGARP